MKELIRCYKKQKIAGFTPEERNYYKINGKKVKKGTSSNKQLNCVKYRRELGFSDWKKTRYCPECHLRALELLKEGKLSLV